ncbi:REP element-mobilizing transposase RayT [Natranaerovirga hydrolytica]|uniref:REP element-mobilizing transposase RayT n=1 Tax=Natranaerovirga hydrolytica TaxID=680378 RepID=A0A4R1MPK4_9FIRM|nr:transposase [Natranaerovirga hydrolytica]TCK93234.1 REP element-mobilizing transposase RayT [Natranaerovirga hydrolytica]
MPRVARIRQNGAYYHIMCRSASEFLLFRDDHDKIRYLQVLKKCLNEFNGILLSYCLMDNHLHLLLNPLNVDISKFMHKLNLSYAIYYNKKYNRRGHVFADRFNSKIITNEKYFFIASLYIHNNPKDLSPYYKKHPHKYPFSSFSYYLGLENDAFNMVNKKILFSMLNPHYTNALAHYIKLNNIYNKLCKKEPIISPDLTNILTNLSMNTYFDELKKENTYEYISGKYLPLVDVNPRDIIYAVTNYFNISNPDLLREKYNRNILDYKSICIIMLRSFCDLTRKQICSLFGNMTISNVYYLSNRGNKILDEQYNRKLLYKTILSDVS